MENYFDQRIARTMRQKWPHLFEPAVVDPAVDFLAQLAGSGAALELGIGTGRLAIPLSRRGVPVHGIELSPDMVAELHAELQAEQEATLHDHAGAADIGVTIGDFASTTVDGGHGGFTLAYLVRNTIANLTTQEAQVACFENVAAHLEPGGCFVIELYVPDLQRLAPGETVRPFDVSPTHLGFEEYEVATQIAWSHHYWTIDGTVETFSAPFRYVWPSELDLMAQIAGLTRRERWGDWDRRPFTRDSRSHNSVWEKPA